MSNDQRNLPQPPVNQPTPQQEGEEVWMACRATEGCPGTHARKVFSHTGSLEGGTVTRFVCTTCGKPFHIPLGTVFG